jgi:hypothetical protein
MIRFSKHALEAMTTRFVRREWVMATINAPDSQESDPVIRSAPGLIVPLLNSGPRPEGCVPSRRR